MDLAGNDVGYRMRKELGMIPDGFASSESAKLPAKYSTLPDKLCEAGYYGQKSGKGWYNYDSAAPRKAVESSDILSFIEQHRVQGGITPRAVTDQEIIERCLYPLVNEGFKILEEGIALRPEDIDVIYTYGYGFPKYRGGPM